MSQPVFQPGIFREYDIRGLADKDFSTDFARVLGRAYARTLTHTTKTPAKGRKRLTVGIGRDCRLTSDKYGDALVTGITQEGLDVIRLGVDPTPLTYFSVFHLDLDGAIMVTGSHNPSEYNGFKICLGRDTLHGSQIQDLKKVVQSVLKEEAAEATKRPSTGAVSDYEIIPPYIAHLLANARPLKRKKIVIDAGNATASTVAPELFRKLGADVVELYCTLDGRFPNHHPDPTVLDNLKDLIATVKREKADFGLAFDGDSDRIGLVDETGRAIFGDEMMVLFARDILQEKPGATIISEVKCSHRLYDDIAAKGGKGIMWKTGHSLIKAKMKETGAALAGEMSGHMFFADRYFGFDDAIYAALRVYEIASKAPGPLSTLLADLPQVLATPEIRLDCVEEKKFQLVEVTKALLRKTGRPITDIDGVRIGFERGWGLVRASNTQPVLVLRFEAETETDMKTYRRTVETALNDAALSIDHPKIDFSASAGH